MSCWLLEVGLLACPVQNIAVPYAVHQAAAGLPCEKALGGCQQVNALS
jgi:hypothetical protein